MSNTGYKFSDADLVTIFSSDTGNNTYASYYNKLNTLDVISSANTVIKGTTEIGYKSPLNSNVDLVSIFSPIYKDITSSGTTTVTIPPWAKKIGFIIQAAGGTSGIAYTDYWKVTQIPASYQPATYQRTYGTAYTRTYGVFYYYNARPQTWKRGQNTHTDQPFQSSAEFQVNTYKTNYSRDASVSSQKYQGSGGGGGGCTAGIYTIDSGDLPATMTISHNYNNSYSTIQFNDIVSTLVKANNGGDVGSNSNTGTDAQPVLTISPNKNTSKDTPGIGGVSIATATTDTRSRITNYFSVAGGNGGQGSTTTEGTIGSSGFKNDETVNSSNIKNKFVPNILNTAGNGGLGSTTTTGIVGDSGIVRYWFIR